MAIHEVTPRRTHPQPFPKPELYEAIFAVNRDLGALIEDFDRLRQFHFKRREIDSFIAKAEHLRARVNGEILEHQLDREMKDEHHFSMLDRRFESRFKDPNDVLVDAEKRLEEMAIDEQGALAEARSLRERREVAEERLRQVMLKNETTEPTGILPPIV